MSNPRQQLDQIIADVERKAYERGWHEAIAAVTEGAAKLRQPLKLEIITKKRRGRPAVAQGYVLDAIIHQPGLSGAQVVTVLQAMGRPVAERTVRTCLRRLRLSHQIRQKKGVWYPASGKEAPKTNGEAP